MKIIIPKVIINMEKAIIAMIKIQMQIKKAVVAIMIIQKIQNLKIF